MITVSQAVCFFLLFFVKMLTIVCVQVIIYIGEKQKGHSLYRPESGHALLKSQLQTKSNNRGKSNDTRN